MVVCLFFIFLFCFFLGREDDSEILYPSDDFLRVMTDLRWRRYETTFIME